MRLQTDLVTHIPLHYNYVRLSRSRANHCQSGSKQNMKPHLSLSLWPSGEPSEKNTQIYTDPNVKMILSILHFAHIDFDKMDHKHHNANRREQVLQRWGLWVRHGGVSHMWEVKYEDTVREDEEEGVVWGLISIQQVPGTGERREAGSWRLAFLHLDIHPTASWLGDQSEK